MITKLKFYSLFLGCCLVVTFFSADAFCQSDTEIVVDPDQIIGEVNPLIYGNSMLGDGTFLSRSNYGVGLWDPYRQRSVAEVITLAKKSGLSIARFPGGANSDFYNWKETIGPLRQRPKFLFGLDEFMKTTEEIGAEVVFTVAYYTGTPQDAADLVEYLNAPQDGSNPGGGVDWAEERAKNGHPAPYKVKYFELGNEVDQGFLKKGVPGADPVEYAEDYIRYRKLMKTIDETIELGAVTVSSSWSKGRSPWNEKLFMKAGGSIDFLIEHTYFRWLATPDSGKTPEKAFAVALNNLSFIDSYYKKLADHFESVTGRSNIPLAITEYNCGFIGEDPVPLRHSLGAALVNAGLLQIFMKPDNTIFMANYWQFVNDYWGIIKNNQYQKGRGSYIKRPNYLVFEMFHDHFGDRLVYVDVNDNHVLADSDENNIFADVQWVKRRDTREDININGDEVEVIFSGEKDTNFFHVFKTAKAKPNTIYEVSGRIRAEDLIDNEGVCLQVSDGRGVGRMRAAVVTDRVWGNTKWIDVKTEYTTMNDTTDIAVSVRRMGRHGKIKGKVFIKDIKLIEKKHNLPKGKNALLVSASKSKDGQTLYIMVLNKNVEEAIPVTFNIKRIISEIVDVWTLSGLSVLSINEDLPGGVTIKKNTVNIDDQNMLQYAFPPHSLTSMEIKVR